MTQFFEEKARKEDMILTLQNIPLDVALYDIRKNITLFTTGYVLDLCIDACPESLALLQVILPKNNLWIKVKSSKNESNENLIYVKNMYLEKQQFECEIEQTSQICDLLKETFPENTIIKEDFISDISQVSDEIIYFLEKSTYL